MASQDSNLARLDLAALSFKSFLNSPLLGIGYHKVAIIKGDFSGVYQSGIGHHSAFFDNLAEYGIIGVYFYALIYYNIIRSSLNKCIGISDKNMFILCYIAYLLFAILNNITFPHIGIIMFFSYTFIYRHTKKWKITTGGYMKKLMKNIIKGNDCLFRIYKKVREFEFKVC